MIGVDGGAIKSLLFAAAAVATVTTTQCGNAGDVPSEADYPTGLLPSDVAAAIAALWASLERKTVLGRLKSHFAKTRALTVAASHPDWASQTGQPKIVTRVQSEMATIDEFVKQTLGAPTHPGTLTTATTPTPPHLDLADAASYKVGLAPKQKKTLEAQYRTNRVQRGTTIVWRAATLERDVWKTENIFDPPELMDPLVWVS